MELNKIIIFAALVALVVATSDEYKDLNEIHDYYAYPKYSFNYGVKVGDYKKHKEERDGNVVHGEYTVSDADGTIRTVTYTVTKHGGFLAMVKKSGDYHDKSDEHIVPIIQEIKPFDVVEEKIKDSKIKHKIMKLKENENHKHKTSLLDIKEYIPKSMHILDSGKRIVENVQDKTSKEHKTKTLVEKVAVMTKNVNTYKKVSDHGKDKLPALRKSEYTKKKNVVKYKPILLTDTNDNGKHKNIVNNMKKDLVETKRVSDNKKKQKVVSMEHKYVGDNKIKQKVLQDKIVDKALKKEIEQDYKQKHLDYISNDGYNYRGVFISNFRLNV